MLLIATVYILIYLQLKKQTHLTQQHSTQDSHAQMCCISRTFKIVLCVFYISYLPFTIQYTIYIYLRNSMKTIDRYVYNGIALPITQFLLFSNCSMNPVIYSKIHMKIFNCFKSLITSFIERLNCCKMLYATPQTATANENQQPSDHISVQYRAGSENIHTIH